MPRTCFVSGPGGEGGGGGRGPGAGGGRAGAAGHLHPLRLLLEDDHLLYPAPDRVPAVADPPRHQEEIL